LNRAATIGRAALARAASLALTALLLGGCDESPAPVLPPGSGAWPMDAGARTGLHRLTDSQFRNASEHLTGFRWDGALPGDYVLHGYAAVGAGEISVAPSDFELYETAAWTLAETAIADAAARDAFLGCPVAALPGREDAFAGPEACLRAFLAGFLGEAWRRPPGLDEIDRQLALYHAVADQTGSATLAVQALLSSALLAPDFLFRVEFGEPVPGERQWRALDDHELAARLSFALLDHPPGDALAARAEAGALSDAAAAQEEAALALQDPLAKGALSSWFAQWVDLGTLALVTKDAAMFPEWNESLRAAMAAESRALFSAVALDQDADLRTLFTRTDSLLTPELAALYGVPLPADPSLMTQLPPERAGLLSRGAFLAIASHATLTSPTRRGKFVRSRLLCQDVPPPPEGVIPSLEGSSALGTLRQQLEQHRQDQACAGCHSQMDPIGFAFEGLDPIGRTRQLDNGYPIDSSAELDGVAVDDAAGLGAALAAHRRLPGCMAKNFWRQALGHLEQRAEDEELDAVAAAFEADGVRLSDLAVRIAGTLAFRRVAVPEGGACSESEEGQLRDCSTDCGDGSEVCEAGTWVGCDAPRPLAESCNGFDDDCDGAVDEDAVRLCSVGGAPGIESCAAGAWSGCAVAPAWETCNGLDDDGDGTADEDLAFDLRGTPWESISASHGDCQPGDGSHSPACRAAVHRNCGATGCSVTGIGPVASDVASGEGTLACLDGAQAAVVTTSYSELSLHHGGCRQGNRFGPDCNAAISRFCAAQGMATGYGPVENSGDVAVIACNPQASVYNTSYRELSAYEGSCNGSNERMGERCDEAFHRFCRALGHRTGHGPLENSGDVAVAACLGVHE
jgi:hypothetical protein